MTPETRAVARTMTLVAAAVAALLVVGLPAAYFAVGYQHAVGAVETQAEVNAQVAGRIVAANPGLWRYERARLAELLERRTSDRIPEAHRLLDRDGALVAESADPLAWPRLARRRAIYDAGERVADLEVVRSLRPVLLGTVGALAVALLVAALVFAAVRTIPYAAVLRAHRRVEDSERRYRSLYESMSEGMALLRVARDPAGAAAGLELVEANPAAARMLGEDARRLAGRDAASLLGGALVPFLPAVLRAAQRGERITFDLDAGEGRRTVRVSAFEPYPEHVATLLEDITEPRRLQEQLTQSQKMEAIGRLAGGVAHDFNNILTVVLSCAAELGETLRGPEREYAREIEQAGLRGTALTRQLLAFGRRQVLRPEVLNVRDVVGDVSAMIRRLIGEQIEIAVDVEDGYIHMDPSQLEHVLVNLAVNARDAMPEGGRLTIRGRAAEVGEGAPGPVPPGSYVVLSVSDTGAGMDAETRRRAFEPFFTTKPKGKGTGLGLAMILGAVEQSGGRIQVASEPGAGSTFTIHLPRVAPPRVPSRPAPAPAERSGHGERILVVDDEPQVRGAVRQFLVAAGYTVIEAASGEQGLGGFLADEDGIQLVVTDLVMPGMSGIALGRAVQARRPVPVLYMSGYSDEVVSGQATLPEGAFVPKPFTRDALLERVSAALGGGQGAPPAL